MPNKTLSKADYTAMLAAFRADAPHYRPSKVAKVCSVDPKTAQRAWTKGWERRDWPPIVETLEKERQKARALLFEHRAEAAKQEQDDRTAAIQDVAQQTADEAQMIRIAQTVVHEGLGAIAAVSTQARALGALIAEQVKVDCQRNDDDAFKMSASQGLGLLDRLAKCTKVLLENARQAMEMERLRLGRPLTGDTVDDDQEMTVEEADLRIDAARQVVESAKAGGGLRVVDGGKVEPTIGKRVELI